MNYKIVPLLALAALPALAQENFQLGLGINYLFGNRSVNVTSTDGTPLGSITREKNPTAAAEAGYRFWNQGPNHLAAMAEFQFPKTFGYHFNLLGFSGVDQVKSYFIAPGLQFQTDVGKVATFGGGVQYRFERMKFLGLDDQPIINNNRLWLNVTAGHTWESTVAAKPYVDLRLAFALSRPKVPNPISLTDDDDFMNLGRSMVGRWEVALHGGIRF